VWTGLWVGTEVQNPPTRLVRAAPNSLKIRVARRFSWPFYQQNSHLDRDKDGIACEKA
jgi:hypothetical protein